MIIYLVFILHEDATVFFSNLTPQRFRMCTRANLNHIKLRNTPVLLLLYHHHHHKKSFCLKPPCDYCALCAFSAFERKKVRKTRLIESFRGDHFCQPNVPSRYLHIFHFYNQMGTRQNAQWHSLSFCKPSAQLYYTIPPAASAL